MIFWVPFVYLLGYFSLMEAYDYAVVNYNLSSDIAYEFDRFIPILAVIPSTFTSYGILNRGALISKSIAKAMDFHHNSEKGNESFTSQNLLTVKEFKKLQLGTMNSYLEDLKKSRRHEQHSLLEPIFTQIAKKSKNPTYIALSLVQLSKNITSVASRSNIAQLKLTSQALDIYSGVEKDEIYYKIANSHAIKLQRQSWLAAEVFTEKILSSPEIHDHVYSLRKFQIRSLRLKQLLLKEVDYTQIRMIKSTISSDNFSTDERLSLHSSIYTIEKGMLFEAKDTDSLGRLLQSEEYLRLGVGGYLNQQFLHNKSQLMRLLGNYDESRSIILKCLERDEKLQLTNNQVWDYVELAKIALASQDYHSSIDYCKIGLDINNQHRQNLRVRLEFLVLLEQLHVHVVNDSDISQIKKEISSITLETGFRAMDS